MPSSFLLKFPHQCVFLSCNPQPSASFSFFGFLRPRLSSCYFWPPRRERRIVYLSGATHTVAGRPRVALLTLCLPFFIPFLRYALPLSATPSHNHQRPASQLLPRIFLASAAQRCLPSLESASAFFRCFRRSLALGQLSPLAAWATRQGCQSVNFRHCDLILHSSAISEQQRTTAELGSWRVLHVVLSAL